MKRNLSKVQIAVIAVFTLICACIGAYLCRSVLRARSYTFDPTVYASELKQADGAVILDRDMDDGSGRYHTTRFSLPKGSFTIDIEYEADQDYNVAVCLDNDVDVQVPLTAGAGVATQIFSLEWPTDRAYFHLEVPEEGTVAIKRITISSARPLYTDGLFQLLILLIIYILFLHHAVRYPEYSKDKKTALLVLLVMAIAVNIPMYTDICTENPGRWSLFSPFDAMTRFGTDTRAQLLRLEGVVYGLLDGQYPVIIAPNYLNECGELSFLYPDFFLYPFAIMRLLGASMLMTFRLMNVTVNIAVMLSMYYVCREISGNRYLSLIMTGVYLFEPHRLRVVLEKGAATGMGLPYIFVPLCILGVYLILKKQKKGAAILALGISGIIESHVTTMILIMILLVLLLIVFFKEMMADKARGMKLTGISILLALAMNLGTMIIFVYYYAKGINTAALKWDEWVQYLLYGAQVVTNVESLYYAAGLIIVIALLIFFREKSIEYRLAVSMSAYTLMLFLMSTEIFPWGYLIEHFSVAGAFTNYMQKPHRFYTVMAGALVISLLLILKDRKPGKRAVTAMAVAGGAVLLLGTCVKYGDYLTISPILYDEIVGDMNTRQNYNYLPVGVDKDMEFSGIASLSDPDAVESLYYSKRGTHADYTYVTDTEGIYAEFPLLTYAGYRAQDENGKDMEIIKGDRGRLTVYLSGDGAQHEIHVGFRVHPIFKLTYILSLAAAAVIILFYIRIYILKQRNRNTDDQND